MFSKKYFKVAVVGLGYVGLPPYLQLKKKGIDVIGIDKDKKKINSLKKNKSYIIDVKNNELNKIKNKTFYTNNEFSRVSGCNFIILCLPTPLKKNNSPDISYIEKSFKEFRKYLKKDTLIVLESTVYPGATKEIFSKYITSTFNINDRIDYGYSSERISPGQTDEKKYKVRYHDITKVVSANKIYSKKKIKFFYNLIFKKVYLAKSIETAEMSKLLENSYRAVNIGLVNEFKIICDNLKIDINDVIDTASTKPFGFTSFRPGPGVGGHCIPVDPMFVKWIAKKKNYDAKFISLAHACNLKITNWVFNKILVRLKKLNKNSFNKIVIIGIAYKEDVNDYRESPAVKLFIKFINKKFKIDFYDPYVDKIYINKRTFNSLKNLNHFKDNIAIIATAHNNVDYKKIYKDSKLIFDTRGVYKNKYSRKIVHL